MEKRYFQVGFTYYPHEQLGSDSYYVYGTEKDAKKFTLKKLKEAPDWIRNQVDKDFNSNSRTKVFCSPIEVHEL